MGFDMGFTPLFFTFFGDILAPGSLALCMWLYTYMAWLLSYI